MRVLFFSQHFVPEVTASRARAQAFAEGLVAQGHEVEVVCAVPNHPGGVIHEGYGGKLIDRRRLDGYGVTYAYVYARPEKTTRNRLLLYGTYAASSVAATLVRTRPDVILATSPPLPVAAGAATAAFRHRVPWVMDVRDLWPEAAVVLGELRGARAIAAAERLEDRLYRSASGIVTTTEPFREQIEAHGITAPVEVIPNGTTALWIDAGQGPIDRAAAGFDADSFTWVYGGNLGIAQGLEHAVDAARILGEGYRLVLLGAGPQRAMLRERAADLPPGAVEFRDPVQPERAAPMLRAADALLVSLADQPELAKFVPSKLFDYCALGRPVIIAAAGEAPRLADADGAALAVPPGDPEALAGAVRAVREQPELAARLDAAGPVFAERYRRERQVERLEQLLVDVVAGR